MTPHCKKHKHPSGQRGVTLIEALVALLVMSFGMVALVGLMANLRRGGDVARQRGEAIRIAQAELANLRSFSLLQRPAGDTTSQDYDNAIASADSRSMPSENANATYTLTRDVTPLVKNSAETLARTVSVTVTWQDRADQQGRIRLDSVISRTDPAYSGAAGITPPSNSTRTTTGRNPVIPAGASPLPNDPTRSLYQIGSSTVLVFNNLTGVIKSICTLTSDTTFASLTADTVKNCTNTTAYFVSGTIWFSNLSQPNPASPEANALPSISATVSLSDSLFSIRQGNKDVLALNQSYTGTPQCFSDAPSSPDSTRYLVNYSCVVYPNLQNPQNWWGRVLLTGLDVGTNASQYRVCRYSADYNGNGYTYAVFSANNATNSLPAFLPNGGSKASYFLIDNEEHPDIYRGVTYSLARQNFLVVRGDVACPSAPAPNVPPAPPPPVGSPTVFVDYSTLQMQP